MDNITFREYVPAGLLVRSLMIGFSLIIILTTILLITIGNLTTTDYYGLIIGWSVLSFVLFLFYNFRELKIEINSDILSVKYGLFNKKSIRLSQITSCKSTNASFGRYGGVGIRYGFDGSIAYTTSLGNAVEIVPKEGHIFVFSSNDPERICKIIEKN